MSLHKSDNVIRGNLETNSIVYIIDEQNVKVTQQKRLSSTSHDYTSTPETASIGTHSSNIF